QPPSTLTLPLDHRPHQRYPHSCPTRRSSDLVSTDAGYRDRILKAEKPNSVAVKYEDLVNAKRADRSTMVKGMDVVYIYHDTIDEDRKSTRLNSSHVSISYAVFCLKRKNREAH